MFVILGSGGSLVYIFNHYLFLLNRFFFKNVCNYYVMVIGSTIGTLRYFSLLSSLINALREKTSTIQRDYRVFSFMWRYNRFLGGSSL